MVDCLPKRQYNYFNNNNTGTAMKTNRELNEAYDAKQKTKVRPKQPAFNYKPLEDVIRIWITKSK